MIENKKTHEKGKNEVNKIHNIKAKTGSSFCPKIRTKQESEKKFRWELYKFGGYNNRRHKLEEKKSKRFINIRIHSLRFDTKTKTEVVVKSFCSIHDNCCQWYSSFVRFSYFLINPRLRKTITAEK